MPHTIQNKNPLLARVRRIKGQAEALEDALGKECDCSAILQQIAVIRGQSMDSWPKSLRAISEST
jgi:DNA-binding FrmR family transcriptional regulator